LDKNVKEMISWEVQVEPPQDMDVTGYDIDPRMAIWKSMSATGQDGHYQKPEEDNDELHHPSMADLIKTLLQKQDTFPVGDIQPVMEADDTWNHQEPERDTDDINHSFSVEEAQNEQEWDEMYQSKMGEVVGYLAPPVAKNKPGTGVHAHTEPEDDTSYHQEPETDTDDINHSLSVEEAQNEQEWHEMYQGKMEEVVGDLAPLVAKNKPGTGVHAHTEPEDDMDDLYQVVDALTPVEVDFVPIGGEVRGENGVGLHLQPEEDMDDMHHADLLKPVLADVSAPAQVRQQQLPDENTYEEYSQPEEDLEDIYDQ